MGHCALGALVSLISQMVQCGFEKQKCFGLAMVHKVSALNAMWI